jgi:uncharacterized protein (TIGR02996 family)
MSDRAGLLRAVLDAPDDDEPRLVFADWFDDHGQHDRAEFVRTQCQIARADPADRDRLAPLADRERELWQTNREAWCAEFPTWARGKVVFRRGFGHALSCTPAQWVKARGLVAKMPLQALNLDKDDFARLADVAAAEHLAGVGVLRTFFGFDHGRRVDAIKALARSPHLSGLRVLDLHQSSFTIGSTRGDVIVGTVGELANVTALESLALGGSEIGPEGVRNLAGSPHVAKLRALDLYHNPIGAGGTRHLAESPNLANLLALDVALTEIGDAGVEALASSPHLADLTHLNLRNHGLSLASAQAVARSPHLRSLRSLSFHFGSVGPDGARALAESANLSGLVYLNLFGNRIDDVGAQALAGSPFLSSLRVLELGGNDLTRTGLRTIAQSEAFPNLEQVSFWGTPDARELADEFKSAPRLPRLRVVGFYPITFDSIARRDAEEPFAWLHGHSLLNRIE